MMQLVKAGLTLAMLIYQGHGHGHGRVSFPAPPAQAGASWYDDAGATACGFHAVYGVANRTLRCGTRVTFFYDGRRVRGTVDDRGPFVDEGYRLWDLGRSTASALGFSGVHTVGYRIG